MNPSTRRLLFAVLWPLLGVLAVPAWSDAPVDFHKSKIEGDGRKQFEYLGYKFDEKSGHILQPDGQTLGEDALKDLVAPVDFKKVALSDEEKNAFILNGCRFDEDTSRIMCLDANGAKIPLPKLSLEYVRKMNSLTQGHNILERMSLILSRQPADKPVPPEVVAELKDMLAKSPGAAVPAALVAALNAPGAKAGEVSAKFENAYMDSTRFFDGQQTLGEHFKNSLPVVPGWNGPHKVPQFFDDNEKKLGEALSSSAIEHFKKSPIGRELLDRYKDKDGKVKLPPFLVLKLDPRMGAVYNQSNKTVVVNQQYVIDGITANLPAGKRDALNKELQDSKKFAAYLLAHPEAREAFLNQHDVTLYHELTHGWQDRRDRLLDEMGRGNTPSAIHIEYEQEAFLQENRYLHWKLQHDPRSVSESDLVSYAQMVVDFDKFKTDIAQQYAQYFPKDSATLATVQDLQKERVSVARRLMGDSLYMRAVETLKLLGIALGNEEIAKVKSESAKRMDDFYKNEYPGLRKEAFPRVVEYYLLKAKSDKIPAQRGSDLLTAEQWAAGSGDAALIEKVRKAKEANK